MSDDKELSGWGEIASFLGVTTRTAQNYERTLGLPIRRMPGPKGRVLADAGELKRWKQTTLVSVPDRTGIDSPTDQPGQSGSLMEHKRRVWRRVAGGAVTVSLAALVVGARLYFQAAMPPADSEIRSNTLIIKDATGRELWQHTFPVKLAKAETVRHQPAPNCRFADIDGDGQTEVLYLHLGENRLTAGTDVLCFSQDGTRVKWRFEPGRPKVIDNAGSVMEPPYYVSAVGVVPERGPGQARIVVTSHHNLEQPSQVGVLDGHGKLLGEYWHPGHLTEMEFADLDGDTHFEVLLGGVNNGNHAATVLVLDPDRVAGTPKNLADSRFGLRGFEAGTERAVVLFPLTCSGRARSHEQPYNRVDGLQVIGKRIRAHVADSPYAADAKWVVYDLDFNFNLLGAVASSELRNFQDELARTHTLDHPFWPREEAELKERLIVRKRW